MAGTAGPALSFAAERSAAERSALQRQALYLALFAAALSLAFSLPTLGMLPIWGDESLTLRSIALPTASLIQERFGNAHSPAYFLVMKALGLADQSHFLVRLPSALGVAFAAACTAILAFRLGGWRAAVLVSFAFATMPTILMEAQDARPNAWHFAFLCLFTLSLANLLDHPRLARAALARRARPEVRGLRWVWAGAVLGALGAMAMLPLGLLAVAAGDAAVLWAARKPAARALLRPWFALRLLTLILLVPIALGLAQGFQLRIGHYWPTPFNWDAIRMVLKISLGGSIDLDPNLYLGPVGNRFLYWGLFGCISLGVLWTRRRPSFALLLFLAFLPPAILLGVSLHTSLLVGRYFAVSTPAALTLGALGLAALWARKPLVAALPAIGLAAVLVLQSLDAMHQLGKPRFDLAMARLHAGGVQELAVTLPHHYRVSVMHRRADSPVLVRLRPLQAVIAANRGQLLWVVSRDDRKIHPLWLHMAEWRDLKHCTPRIPGLNILVIAPEDELLALSCPELSDPS